MREFKDHRGREWRAWEVTPEAIYPQTKAEDYLADCFRSGWLVFETVDALDKRRLCPPPFGWEQRSNADLMDLVERAEVLRPAGGRHKRKPRHADLPPGVPPDIAASMPRDARGNLDMRHLGVVRSFSYPGGQVWRVRVMMRDDGAAQAVLRFASDTHSIDLTEWPPDWVDLSDRQLVELLRSGQSAPERREVDQPHRRYDDSRSGG